MLGPVASGLFAAVVASLPHWFARNMPGTSSPIALLFVAVFVMLLQRLVIERRAGSAVYDGLADLFIHVHTLSVPDSSVRWALRGLISLCFSVCGGVIGAEGPAIEFGHAAAMRFRSRAERWFEQRRRTDASVALSAGISAAFLAPFTGVLLPIELGMGGRTLSTVVASVAAFLGTRYLFSSYGLGWGELGAVARDFKVFDVQTWIGVVLIGVLVGAFSAGLVRLLRFAQNSLLELFQSQVWLRMLVAGVLLFLITITYPAGHAPSWVLFEKALWSTGAPVETGLSFFGQFLSLILIVGGIGTLGVFWPLISLGAVAGVGLGQLALHHLPASTAGFSGAAAIWGAVLGAPITATVLAYELTHQLDIVIPCFAAAWIARETRRRLKTASLVEVDLKARDMKLVEGRMASVLEALFVKDAMVVDHELVHEQEPVSEIHDRLMTSRYPFLPVVSAQGIYKGLLTVDMVQEAYQDAWRTQQAHTSNSPLTKLLEAKDLLYRVGHQAPTVRVDDCLSATTGLFNSLPCVTVLDLDGRVIGLLFNYNVRLAYDREVARKARVDVLKRPHDE